MHFTATREFSGYDSADGVAEARSADQQAGGGASPTSTLQQLIVVPIAISIARSIVESHHYTHSLPGGTNLAFGVVFLGRLLGALTLGVGPKEGHSLVEGAEPKNYLTLTRIWLSDVLPPNSESRVLGFLLRSLRRHTHLKFLLTYADPAQGHIGIIYQATGWIYTGLSEAMPYYDVGDGVARHSRSLSHAIGTHSLAYFKAHDIPIKKVAQRSKHRYIYFLDRSWRKYLRVDELPYPKGENLHEGR